jgi:hypothetical protein
MEYSVAACIKHINNEHDLYKPHELVELNPKSISLSQIVQEFEMCHSFWLIELLEVFQ